MLINLPFRFVSLIFILIPFALLSGPFLPDFFLCIIALYFLVISIKDRLYYYYKNPLVIFLFVFYFYLLFRGIFSSNIYDSLINYNGPIFYFRYIFFVMGVCYLCNKSNKLLKYFSLSLLIVILFTSLDGFIQWILGYNLLGFKSPSIRVTGIFNQEEILGHFLAHVVPLLVALLTFLFQDDRKKIYLIILTLMVTEIIVFLSNDRAGFLKILQFSLLLLFLSSNLKLTRLISLVISTIIIIGLLKFSENSSQRFEQTIKDVSSTTVPYMPWGPSHETHFKVAISMFNDNKFFGQGPQMFKSLCKIVPEYQIGCTSHPHNYYIQTAAELGLIGLIFLFFGFFLYSFKLLMHFLSLYFTKNKKYLMKDYELFLICFIFLLFWPLIPHQSFYNNWLNVMVYLPFGFLLYFRTLKKN